MNITEPIETVLTTSNVAESLYSEWATATTYAIGDKVYVTLESDGVTERKPHKVYEALTAGAGLYPPDNALDWLDSGATNRWAMFDTLASTNTVNATAIQVTLEAQKVDKLFLFGLDAETVQITVKDSTGTLISEDTISLRETGATSSWSEYFFSAIEYRSHLAYDLPGYFLSVTVELTITAITASTAKCAQCLIGLKKYIGQTKYGAKSGISDYSKKTVDDFGNTVFVERAFAKTVDIDVWVEHDVYASKYDFIAKTLANIRATPVVFDTNNDDVMQLGYDRAAFYVFGYYKDFDLTAEYATVSNCNLTIEGLI